MEVGGRCVDVDGGRCVGGKVWMEVGGRCVDVDGGRFLGVCEGTSV